MSATRLLRPNKAATVWAALARGNGTAHAVPSCSPFPYCTALARGNGTAPALPSFSPFPYCTALARRNGTAPALPSISPSLYCISFFIGPRHMSFNRRRTSLLDETIKEIINEINENLKDVDKSFGSEGEMQKEHHFSLLNHEFEKLISEHRYMAEERRRFNKKMHGELRRIRDEITDLTTKIDRAQPEAAEYDVLKYYIGTLLSILDVGLAISCILM